MEQQYMQLTSHLLKQLIREAMQDDLEFLRDMKYSDVDLEAYKKIISMYQSAQQNNDTVTLQYIDSMHNIPRDKEAGKLFTFEDISLIDEWLDDLDDEDPGDWMGNVTKGDFAGFIRVNRKPGDPSYRSSSGTISLGSRDEMDKKWAASKAAGKKEADRLWPLAHFVHEGTENKRWAGKFGAPYDLEPI